MQRFPFSVVYLNERDLIIVVAVAQAVLAAGVV
jgi:hypothetical protein